jgi:hypothetical protein
MRAAPLLHPALKHKFVRRCGVDQRFALIPVVQRRLF